MDKIVTETTDVKILNGLVEKVFTQENKYDFTPNDIIQSFKKAYERFINNDLTEEIL